MYPFGPSASPSPSLCSQTSHDTPTAASPAKSPRPVYFISRTNGALVPLIAVDELPHNVRLLGLTRTINYDQTYHMQHLGIIPHTGRTYKLELPYPDGRSANSTFVQALPKDEIIAFQTRARQYLAPDADVRNRQVHLRRYPPSPPSSPEVDVSPKAERPRVPTAEGKPTISPASIDMLPRSAPAKPVEPKLPKSLIPPSAKLPDGQKKTFCAYWIRTGNCGYMQQGCLFKHEMPDPSTLRKIGFKEVPRWYSERRRAPNPQALDPKLWIRPRSRSSSISSGSDAESDDGKQNNVGSIKATSQEQIKTLGGDELKHTPQKVASSLSPASVRAMLNGRSHSVASNHSDLIAFEALRPFSTTALKAGSPADPNSITTPQSDPTLKEVRSKSLVRATNGGLLASRHAPKFDGNELAPVTPTEPLAMRRKSSAAPLISFPEQRRPSSQVKWKMSVASAKGGSVEGGRGGSVASDGVATGKNKSAGGGQKQGKKVGKQFTVDARESTVVVGKVGAGAGGSKAAGKSGVTEDTGSAVREKKTLELGTAEKKGDGKEEVEKGEEKACVEITSEKKAASGVLGKKDAETPKKSIGHCAAKSVVKVSASGVDNKADGQTEQQSLI